MIIKIKIHRDFVVLRDVTRRDLNICWWAQPKLLDLVPAIVTYHLVIGCVSVAPARIWRKAAVTLIRIIFLNNKAQNFCCLVIHLELTLYGAVNTWTPLKLFTWRFLIRLHCLRFWLKTQKSLELIKFYQCLRKLDVNHWRLSYSCYVWEFCLNPKLVVHCLNFLASHHKFM